MRIAKYLPLIVLIVAIALLTADNSFAATDSIKQIRDAFQTAGATYGSKLQGYAFGIFKLCLLVDVGIFGLRAALNRGEIGETISQFIMMLLFATFCAVAIKYYPGWTHFLLDKSSSIASAVGGVPIELSPIDVGFSILAMVNKQCSFWSPIESLGYYIFSAVILACLAIMTARMLVILCESYIAMNVAILLLGFGGSSMLKDYAINTMRYAVSVAFKLFVMQLLVAVGISFVTNLASINKVGYQDLAILLATAIVLLVLVNTLPETVAGIISGSHTGSGVGLGSAAKGVAAAAVGAAALAGGAAIGGAKAYNTVSRAVKLASMDGHTGAANKAKGAAGHLWNSFQAARQDAATNPGGSIASRMHSNVKDMHQAQKAMKDPNHQANPYRINRLADSSGDAKKANDSADSTGGG